MLLWLVAMTTASKPATASRFQSIERVPAQCGCSRVGLDHGDVGIVSRTTAAPRCFSISIRT